MAPSPNRRELVLDNGRVFVEVPRLMTDDELVAVFEDFIAEVHGGSQSARKQRRKRRPNRRNHPKAALYLRIGTQKSADSGFRRCRRPASTWLASALTAAWTAAYLSVPITLFTASMTSTLGFVTQ